MKALKLLILTTVLALLGACSGAPPKPSELPQPKHDYSAQAYRIGVGDKLRVDVWRNKDLSVQVPVRPDGKISMPLIGDVLAAGKTTEQLASDVSTKLQQYVRSPQVTVIVTNPSSTDFENRVRITGAVQQPTSMPFRKGMTVLDVVLSAGGTNQFASPNKAKLYRTVNGKVHEYPIYLNQIINNGDLSTNYRLAPGDIIAVPQRAF